MTDYIQHCALVLVLTFVSLQVSTVVAAPKQTVEFKFGEYKIKIPTNQRIQVPKLKAADLTGPDLTRLLNVAAEAAGETPVRLEHKISPLQSLKSGPLLQETTGLGPPFPQRLTTPQEIKDPVLYPTSSIRSTPDLPKHHHVDQLTALHSPSQNPPNFQLKEPIHALSPSNHGLPLPITNYHPLGKPQQPLKKVFDLPSALPRSSSSQKYERLNMTTVVTDVPTNISVLTQGTTTQLALPLNRTSTLATWKATTRLLPTQTEVTIMSTPLIASTLNQLTVTALAIPKSESVTTNPLRTLVDSQLESTTPPPPAIVVYHEEPRITTATSATAVTSKLGDITKTVSPSAFDLPLHVQLATTTVVTQPDTATRIMASQVKESPATVGLTQPEAITITNKEEVTARISIPTTVVSQPEPMISVPSTAIVTQSEPTTDEYLVLGASHSVSKTTVTSSPVVNLPLEPTKITPTSPVTIPRLQPATTASNDRAVPSQSKSMKTASTIIVEPTQSPPTIIVVNPLDQTGFSSTSEFAPTTSISSVEESQTEQPITGPSSLYMGTRPEQITITLTPAVELNQLESTPVLVTQPEQRTTVAVVQPQSIIATKHGQITTGLSTELENPATLTSNVPTETVFLHQSTPIPTFSTPTINYTETAPTITTSTLTIVTDILPSNASLLITKLEATTEQALETNVTREKLLSVSAADLVSSNTGIGDTLKESSSPGLTSPRSRPRKRCSKSRKSKKIPGSKCRKKRRRQGSTTTTSNTFN